MMKDYMIKWTENIGYNIDLEQWTQTWQNNIKFTKLVSFKIKKREGPRKWKVST